ncbi:hypothetical protein IEO21_07965 [Rhodonia placenta]|uniref:Uncharacterized protein n=1 Tax=Rhodonia placenta TaxID=104341 RepID=A0A8H7TZT8_9APHY|nr:hypothetical protein IEO21_07965 [Postia placenta]
MFDRHSGTGFTSTSPSSSPVTHEVEGNSDFDYYRLGSDGLVPASSSPLGSSSPAITPPDYCPEETTSRDLFSQSSSCVSSRRSSRRVEEDVSSEKAAVGLQDTQRVAEFEDDPDLFGQSESTQTPCEESVVASAPQSPFLYRLHELLLIAQRERRQAEFRRYLAVGEHSASAILDNDSSVSTVSEHETRADSTPPSDLASGSDGMQTQCLSSPHLSAISGSRDVLHTGSLDAEFKARNSTDHSDAGLEAASTVSSGPIKDSSDHRFQSIPRVSDCSARGATSGEQYAPEHASPGFPGTSNAPSESSGPAHASSSGTKRRLSQVLTSGPCVEDPGSADFMKIDAYTQVAYTENVAAQPRLKRHKTNTRTSRFFAQKDSVFRRPSLKSANHVRQQANKETIAPSGRLYARRAASLRRADSLRSEPAQNANRIPLRKVMFITPFLRKRTEVISQTPAIALPSSSFSIVATNDDIHLDVKTPDKHCASPTSLYYGYIPTEPATPVPRSRRRNRVAAPPLSPMPNPFPILAPPSYEDIPREPLSDEAAAEARIKIMLAKESVEREADGLFCHAVHAHTDIQEPNSQNGFGEHHIGKCEAIKSPNFAGSRRKIRDCPLQDGEHCGGRDTLDSSFLGPQLVSGIDENLRMEVIDWMLEALPPVIPSTSAVSSRSALYEQLTTSDETRFHAAYIFTRYFLRLSSPASSPSIGVNRELVLEDEGKEAVTWDTAVACMALSVKFHRDVFMPLYSINAHEFIAIAPHTMTYDDLETAHRDILYALSYSIGSVTPLAYMQELWLALPSLRKLLAFDDGWSIAQEEAWAILLEALMQPDALRFPVSLLTACATIDGAIESLILKYQSNVRSGGEIGHARRAHFRTKASKAVVTVRLDIQEVLQYSDADISACRQWLRPVS